MAHNRLYNERSPKCDIGLDTLDGIKLFVCFELGGERGNNKTTESAVKLIEVRVVL